MLPLDDKKWKELEGGYRQKYDASILLSELNSKNIPPHSVWKELWENLHHQGDVGVASYAAIPHIARIVRERKMLDFNPFALAVVIELARGQSGNPQLPKWLKKSYQQALRDMAEYICENFRENWDSSLLKSALGLIAVVKGNRDLGELILTVDDGDEKYMLEKYFED